MNGFQLFLLSSVITSYCCHQLLSIVISFNGFQFFFLSFVITSYCCHQLLSIIISFIGFQFFFLSFVITSYCCHKLLSIIIVLSLVSLFVTVMYFILILAFLSFFFIPLES